MDKEIVNKVISEYAIEVANLRLAVVTLEHEIAKLQEKEQQKDKE